MTCFKNEKSDKSFYKTRQSLKESKFSNDMKKILVRLFQNIHEFKSESVKFAEKTNILARKTRSGIVYSSFARKINKEIQLF